MGVNVVEPTRAFPRYSINNTEDNEPVVSSCDVTVMSCDVTVMSCDVTVMSCVPLQGFPVMNRGAPLLLNLQPGQTVQPLTLIQSPSLGQLVRPSVGVSPVPQGQAVQARPGPAPSRGSAFTAMQLPATLTFRTGTPGPGPSSDHTPSPAPSFITAHSVTSLPTSDPPRVVMTVEEFYYGTFEGDLSLRKPLQLGIKTSTFTCHICHYLAENNLRLMQHMLHHSELIGGRAPGDDRKCCKFCYRQFSSPDQLQSHEDQVHGPALSSCLCRICEWAFENEPAFLNHMKSNHKPGEMPYVCQVCSYRSSFSADIVQHFASFHKDSRFLMCLFCLKVTRNPVSYQQHLLRHQAFHCNRCRLQFIFLKDKMQHKLENHRSFRRPAQLEGLPPGSKVISDPWAESTGGTQTISQSTGETETMNYLVCLECGTRVLDFSAHYPTHVRCLLCPYSSCCSRAYASHMIHVFRLQCSHCGFSSQTADHMADHLLRNPEHHSATCNIERDIQFCPSEEHQPSEETEPVQKQDLLDLSWRLADCWTQPSECDCSDSTIASFEQSAGPHHFLSKNTDAIDFFHLLFPSELMELITNETNAHAKTSHFLGYGYSDWVPTTIHEIKGFIGLVVLMGIQNLPDLSHYWSWSHYDNSYTFYRAMSFKRFKQIAANIRMGSFTTAEFRGTGEPGDSLHIFRPMLNILEGAVWDAYQPNCCLSVDRALLPSPEEVSCDGKADPKTQPQVWLLCDSKSGYCHRFFIQVGEKEGQEQGFTVVPELVKDLVDKHHQLYLASSLASVPLMQKLLDQGIYASSSFPPLSHILPRELWEEGCLEKPGDFLQRQFGPLLATRWRDTKEMGCLSTNADPGEQDTVWRRSQTKVGGLDPIDRPMAFCLLQENMRGVDICKQLLACNPLGGIPQDRHWRRLFWFLVNLSIVNAFIVLRESRKENPPAWVQDGLFTQVNFRKRLGNQLAKCAQNYSETVEIASSRGMRVKPTEVPVKQRHRMGKISSISKRCKTCHLRNLRHESVYGCIVCRTNLCKQPSCFWEFHGLSPINKGQYFIQLISRNDQQDFVLSEVIVDNNIDKRTSGSLRCSGEITVKEVEDNVDGAMAPVEDMDFSDNELDDIDDDDELEDIKDKFINEEKRPMSDLPSRTTTPPGHPRPATTSSACKERDDFLTARQLRIALFALCDGLRQASRVFLTEPPLIRSWLKDARRRLKSTVREQKSDADGGDLMVAWVLSMREQQLPITESNLFHKVSILKKKGGFSDSFRISYDWAVGFMLRHRLGVQSSGRAATLAHALPLSLEAKIKSFRDFTQKVIRVNKLSESTVAAMDELCLFVDLRLVQDKSRRSEALELTGSLPLVTVYLAVLANGTMLPSVVLANPQLAEKVLPDFILLETGPESLLVEQALDLWTNKVWLKHMAGPTRPRKSMLVLDRHREHMGDSFLTSISGSGTLPAVIPGGDSFRLQPLEICVKPVLQHFLLSRWARFTRGNPKELEETSPHQLQANVAQLLVDWAVEALTQLKKLPQLWKESFRLTGLLPGREVEEETMSPEEIQSDLLKTLTETLLGPEALKADYSELLELEDNEDTEEEQGEEQRASKEKQGEGKDAKKDREETREEIKAEGKETKERRPVDTEKDTIKGEEDRKKTEEDMNKEVEKLEEDSEEEGKETEEDRKEVSKERRETRIVIGEEVGDEWKITVKSRADGVEDDEMDES
uniref:Pogo transposable element derived with ZNF domain b n=1 Tax=Cyclopterus lumpus TaxID=8103 RepID=A0A8C3AX71_CYCLU